MCLQYTHFPFFPKPQNTIWWSLGMSIVGCHQLRHIKSYFLWRRCWRWLQVFDAEWQWLQQHILHPWIHHSLVCFCDLPLVLIEFRCIVFEFLEVGWASCFGGTQECNSRMRSVLVVENLRQGKNASFCESWNLTCSTTNTFALKRLVSVFPNHRLSNIGQSGTYFFLLPIS